MHPTSAPHTGGTLTLVGAQGVPRGGLAGLFTSVGAGAAEGHRAPPQTKQGLAGAGIPWDAAPSDARVPPLRVWVLPTMGWIPLGSGGLQALGSPSCPPQVGQPHSCCSLLAVPSTKWSTWGLASGCTGHWPHGSPSGPWPALGSLLPWPPPAQGLESPRAPRLFQAGSIPVHKPWPWPRSPMA